MSKIENDIVIDILNIYHTLTPPIYTNL